MQASRWPAGMGIAAFFSALTLAPVAQAASISPNVRIDPPRATNYTETVSIAKFDPSLGVLTSILLTFDSVVEGSLSVDNAGPSAASGTLNLSADVGLSQTVLGDLFNLTPTDSKPFSVAADDGDATGAYTGADSAVFTDLQGTATGTKSYSAGSSALAAFTGTGNIDFSVKATAKSNAVSPDSGNLDQRFRTRAGVNFTVTYNYDPVTRVPEGSALVGVGLLATTLLSSQRKRFAR